MATAPLRPRLPAVSDRVRRYWTDESRTHKCHDCKAPTKKRDRILVERIGHLPARYRCLECGLDAITTPDRR